MKDTEKRYCSSRVRETLKARLEALKKSHMAKPTGLTPKEKLDLIRNGDVDLRRGARLDWPLEQAFDFSWQEKNAEPVLNDDTYKPAAAELQREADKIVDEIMVGAEDKAVELMRKFCGT